jgi:hypothetical protein
MDSRSAREGKAVLESTFKRTLEANCRYYEAMANATASYLQTLAALLTDVVASRASSPSAAVASASASSANAQSRAASTLVLEGVAGTRAVAAFAVDNSLDVGVTASVEASRFRSEHGHEIEASLTLEPARFTLQPGERQQILISATFGEHMQADVSYRGQIRVPHLSNTVVPVLLRRKLDVPLQADAKAESRPRVRKPPKAETRLRSKKRSGSATG